MRQLILFLAKYRSTLLLIVFVLIALLRHSLKNPVAEHRLNNVGFGTIASVHNGLSGWKQYWRLEAINEELARENAALRSGGTRASANHFSNSTDYDFIPARVVDYSYTKRNNYIIVHAGRRDGIQPGQKTSATYRTHGVVPFSCVFLNGNKEKYIVIKQST